LKIPHIKEKKASVSLKMSSKRIEIFKKAAISLKISLKCHAFSKKNPWHFPHCHNDHAAPGKTIKFKYFQNLK
jgi:hypothetical protein